MTAGTAGRLPATSALAPMSSPSAETSRSLWQSVPCPLTQVPPKLALCKEKPKTQNPKPKTLVPKPCLLAVLLAASGDTPTFQDVAPGYSESYIASL